MAITPCFDPTTGASGGASGGGGTPSLDAVAFTVVDLTDGSWTLYDPDSAVQSVAFAGGFNTVTFNALLASSNNNWSTTGDHRAPRWYKLLTIGANQVVTGSHMAFTSRLQDDNTVNDFNRQVVIGPAIDPGAIPSLTILGTGGQFNKTTAGSPAYGTWQVNASTTSASASNVYGKTTVAWMGDSAGAGVYVNLDTNDEAVNSGSRNSNQNNLTGGAVANVYVMVGVGPRGSADAIALNDQMKFKAGYIALTTEVP
jgi:hypothetical protein